MHNQLLFDTQAKSAVLFTLAVCDFNFFIFAGKWLFFSDEKVNSHKRWIFLCGKITSFVEVVTGSSSCVVMGAV